MGTDQDNKDKTPQHPASAIDHDEYVVVSFEIPKVREVLRHAFSSSDHRPGYRVPDRSPDDGNTKNHKAKGSDEINNPRASTSEKKAPDIWVVFDPELCLFSFKKGSPTVPIFLASSGSTESRAVPGIEYTYPIQHQSDRAWSDVMDFMMQANQGQSVFYSLSSEEVRDHLDHRQAFMDVRFHADRIEWCTTPGFCLATYSISEKR